MIDFNTNVGFQGEDPIKPKEDFTTFGGSMKDFGAGLGLSVVKGVEGILDLGNIIPGVDYDTKLVEDVKDIFNYEESDSFAEQFGEFAGFAISLATGAGAVGQAASVTSKLAKGSSVLRRGYTKSRAAQSTYAMVLKHPKIAKNLSTNAKFAVAAFLETAGDDAFDMLKMLNLEDDSLLAHFGINDELADFRSFAGINEGDSELTQRLKGALQGFAIGIPIDFAFSAIGAGVMKGGAGVMKGIRSFSRTPQLTVNPSQGTQALPQSGSQAATHDANVDRLRGLAQALDEGFTINGNKTKIIDVAESIKGNSSTTVTSDAIFVHSLRSVEKELYKRLASSTITDIERAAIQKDLLEVARLNIILETKTPTLFRPGNTAPLEHNKVVGRLSGLDNLTGDKQVQALIDAGNILDPTVLRPNYTRLSTVPDLNLPRTSLKGTSEEFLLATKTLSEGASPLDQLALTELAALRGGFIGPTRVQLKEAEKVIAGILDAESIETLKKFSREVGQAYRTNPGETVKKLDVDKIYVAYVQHFSSLEEQLNKALLQPITASFTKQKKDLLVTQILDHYTTLKDSIEGVIRPKSLHTKRNLASLSKEQIENFSPERAEKELARLGGKGKYKTEELLKTNSAVNSMVPPLVTSTLSKVKQSLSFGLASRAAELNVAMIMANAKLLASNVLQNAIKYGSDKTVGKLGRFLLKTATMTVPSVNKLTLNKGLNNIRLWGKLSKSSYEGQGRSGVGSILSDINSSGEIRPNVSGFKKESKMRSIGFTLASSADDGSKALVLLADTLDELSKRTDLSPEQFNLVEEQLPKFIETRLRLGEVNKSNILDDISTIVDSNRIGTPPSASADLATETLRGQVSTIIDNAFDKAKEATFTSGQTIEEISMEHGRHLAAIAKVTRNVAAGTQEIPIAGPILRTITKPFVATPLNAVLYGSSFTPLSKSWWKGMFAPILDRNPGAFPRLENIMGLDFMKDPKIASKVGKAWTGTAIWGGTIAANAAGIIDVTGRGPSEPNARRAWAEAGHKPYSIKVVGTNTEISLKRLGPIAMPFIFAAEQIQILGDNPWNEEELGDQMKGLMAGAMEVYLDMSSMDGSAKLLDAIINHDESAINQILASIALPAAGSIAQPLGQLLPSAGALGSFASEFFTPEAQTPAAGRIDSVVTQIQNRYARFSSDSRRNIYGEVIDRNLWNAAANTFGIAEFSTVKDSPINKELNTLGMPVGKMSHIMSGLNLTDEAFAIGEQTSYDRLQEHFGSVRINGRNIQEALEKLIKSPRYRKLSTEGIPELGVDSPRSKEVKKLFSIYKSSANSELLKESKPLREQLRLIEAAKISLQSGKSPSSVISQMFKI